MPYGFGARTVLSGDGPACNLFSMTGDYMNPFVTKNQEVVNCYENTIKGVKLALPVMYKNIIKFVCDLAQKEMSEDIMELKNYYVLTLLMAGMVDDFQDALNELLRAANLPVSILVVKIGKNSEENDSEQFIKKSMAAFETSERVFIDLLDFENYKNDKNMHTNFYKQQFEYDLIKNIPTQIEKYFEMQKFELDSEEFTD
jgi:hypothetical protein